MEKKTNWFFLIFMALLLLVLRAPSYEMPLDPDSGANAFFARQMIRGETLYDKFHPAHQLPGIYYTFAVAFKLFGDHPLTPKLLLIPWALTCAWLLYITGRSFFDEQTGRMASFFFVLVSSQKWVTGMTVEMEHFANLPLIASMLLSMSLLRKRAAAWQYFWVGLLGAICFLYKVIFVAPLIVAGVSILLMAWITRKEANTLRITLLRFLWLGLGFVFPLAFVAGYFANLGLWERFLLVFQFGFDYLNDPRLMGGSDLPRPFGFPLFWLSVNNIVLLLFGLIAMYRLLRRSLPLRNTDQLIGLGLTLWLIISMALAGMRGGGFAHYVLPVIPPLALLGAVEISTSYQRWKTISSERTVAIGRSIFVALVVVNFLVANFGIYRDFAAYKLGHDSYDEFLRHVDENGYISQQVAKYLRENTTPHDFIYIWSVYVDVYYYADRFPPIDILWPSYVAATGPANRIFDVNTKYIILDSPDRLLRPRWLLEGLATDYTLETVIERWEIYRRR